MSKQPKIAVVAMQGDFQKHIETLSRLGADAYMARLPNDVARADAIVMPGGESTTIGKLMARYGLDLAILDAADAGKPIYGTCAGLILLAKSIAGGTEERGGQPVLGLLDVEVARNGFGRQVDSFETAIVVPALGAEPLRTTFIRAPYVVRAGPDVEVLGEHSGKIVFVRQENILGSSFHPELTDDDRAHQLFLSMLTAKRTNLT